MVDAAYLQAVSKAVAEGHEKKLAASHVNAHRADYGLPDRPFRGFCGLAGPQEPAT